MKRVFDEFGPIAEKSGAALMTGMGFDYVPGDMIASLTAEGMGPLEEISLNYAVAGFGPSRGTARTALGQIAGEDVQWLEGEYVPGDRSISRGKFDFGGEIGVQRMTRYPAGEHVTVPRHVETRTVRTALTASTTSPVAIGAPVADDRPQRRAQDPAFAGVRRSRQPAARGPGRGQAARRALHDRLRRPGRIPAAARRDPRRGRLRHDGALDRGRRAPLRGTRLSGSPGRLRRPRRSTPRKFLPELSELRRRTRNNSGMSYDGKVAVIGAGSSGIASCQVLNARGIEFDCFEVGSEVGGNWRYMNDNGMSAAYRSLHINTSRRTMAYATYPMPEDLPDYPNHFQIAQYFDDYVDHFGFRDRIRFRDRGDARRAEGRRLGGLLA